MCLTTCLAIIIFIINNNCMRVDDLTIDAIIRKYEHRQSQLLSNNLQQTKGENTKNNISVRKKQVEISGVTTPEFSTAVGRRQINKKLGQKEQEEVQRTHKKQENLCLREDMSFSTDRKDVQAVLKQLEQTEERLAKSQRNFAEVSRRYQQLQRQKRDTEVNQRLRQHGTGQLQERVVTLQRQNLNYRQCLATKDSNISILREKLKQKNERLIQTERACSELKSQIVAANEQTEKEKLKLDMRQREKEQMIIRVRSEMNRLEKSLQQRQIQKQNLLDEIQRGYRNHQQELEVVKQSYLQVQQQYKEWIDTCNAEKLALISQYERKLAEARTSAQNAPVFKVELFQEELSRREKQSNKLIALTAKQATDLKQIRGQLQSAEKVKAQLILKVSSLENMLISKAEMLASLETAYAKLIEQYRVEEENSREWRQKYNGVNRQFVQLRNKCAVLFESLQQNKRESQGQNVELTRLRKELAYCRQQLQRSRDNQTALEVKLAESTRAVKERLNKIEQERQESLTELLAQRLQNARLQEELQETRTHLKRQYDLSIENTKKQLEKQLQQASSKTTRGNDPEKQQLYLQLRALERRYELLANEIVTVDEVMDMASKVKRRHQPLKKSVLRA